MPNVSLKTVYQTLHDLAELGEISALDLGTGSARFDPNVESSHHHLVCRSCGKVRDVDADFPELAGSRRSRAGFQRPQCRGRLPWPVRRVPVRTRSWRRSNLNHQQQ